MLSVPQFSYFLSHKKNPVLTNSQIWTTPIPMNRKHRMNHSGFVLSHGEYFTAVRNFLERNKFEIITRAVSQHLHQEVKSEDIKEINIFLEKHGEFYHPARIETICHGTAIPFVLNVAISDSGKQCIQGEYNLIKQLHEDFPISFLPKVYGEGHVSIADDEIRMFLGEWFQGYNEFHISFDPVDEKHKIVVWDDEHGNYFLTDDQTINLYRQAARILTGYYNVETFDQILSWHHGAGDFVLKCQNKRMDLKLITVRQYGPLFKNESDREDKKPDSEMILEALLVFFLNLTIKIRLDRLDGVGEIVWSDDIAVEGILKGVLEGLALTPPNISIPYSLMNSFQNHLISCRQSDLLGLSQAMVDAYNPESPEIPVIQKNLKRHVTTLFNLIKQNQKIQ